MFCSLAVGGKPPTYTLRACRVACWLGGCTTPAHKGASELIVSCQGVEFCGASQGAAERAVVAWCCSLAVGGTPCPCTHAMLPAGLGKDELVALVGREARLSLSQLGCTGGPSQGAAQQVCRGSSDTVPHHSCSEHSMRAAERLLPSSGNAQYGRRAAEAAAAPKPVCCCWRCLCGCCVQRAIMDRYLARAGSQRGACGPERQLTSGGHTHHGRRTAEAAAAAKAVCCCWRCLSGRHVVAQLRQARNPACWGLVKACTQPMAGLLCLSKPYRVSAPRHPCFACCLADRRHSTRLGK